MNHPAFRPIGLLLALALVPVPPPAGAGETDTPPPSLEERVEVRLIQVAVAVVDPKAGTRASVPGLKREQFRVLVDGRPLSESASQRLIVDEICERTPDAEGAAADDSGPPRSVIAVVDFNYLDARARHLVAAALDKFADAGLHPRQQIKVYGLTRQVRRLTDGFVRDADALKRAAARVRGEWFSRRDAAGMSGLAPGAADAGAPSSDPFEADDAPADPGPLDFAGRLSGAFGTLGAGAAAQIEIALGSSTESDIWGDAASYYDPLASLAAIEGIIRAHSSLSGQKGLILFTSEAFRIAREDRLAEAVQAMSDLSRRENITIFTVDAEGLAGQRRRSSELLSALAGDSGGTSLRRTADLVRSFGQAFDQLSCYYLLSVPIPAATREAVRHSLSVRLDTETYRDLWGLSVRAPTTLVIPTQAERRENERLAVLLSPEDFPDPPLAVMIEYPRTLSSREVMPVRFRVPLSALSWRRASGGVAEARVLFEGLLERDRRDRSEIVCRAGVDRVGALTLRRRSAARPRADAGLVFEIYCGFARDGLYTARGVLTDMIDERSGGGRSTVFVRRDAGPEWRLDEPRLLAASGHDLLWRSGWDAARADAGRRAFFPVDPTRPIDVENRIRFDGVLCGPGGSAAALPRVVLLRERQDGRFFAHQGFSPGKDLVAAAEREKAFCAPLVIDMEEFSLEPGNYELRVVADPDEHALASVRFSVR